MTVICYYDRCCHDESLCHSVWSVCLSVCGLCRVAVSLNIAGLRNVLDLCKQMKKLEVIVHALYPFMLHVLCFVFYIFCILCISLLLHLVTVCNCHTE